MAPLARLAIATLIAILCAARPGAADDLDTIKARGTIRVGVKTDYRPFSYQEMSGRIVGFEPDLAEDVASALGVRLQLVPVTTTDRIEKLLDGEIDLIAATMTDTFERRARVRLVEPLYYSTFVNLLLRRDAPVAAWEDIAGRTLCVSEGAWYNEIVAERFRPVMLSFIGSSEPVEALLKGRCIGYLFDQAFIVGKIQESLILDQVHMPLRGILRAPWAMAVRPGERRFAEFMEDLTIRWMLTGRLIELESKWNIPPSDYAAAMTARYNKAKP